MGIPPWRAGPLLPAARSCETGAGAMTTSLLPLDRRVRAYCLGAIRRPVAAPPGPYPLPRVDRALASAALRCAREAGRLLVLVRGRSGSGRDLAVLRLLGAKTGRERATRRAKTLDV